MKKKTRFDKFSPAEKFIIQKLENELPANLTYHGFHHTLDVLKAALEIADAENLSQKDIRLLRIGVLYHDAGFMYVYKNHEEKGCEIAKEYLPAFGFNNEEIAIICKLIMATQIPQGPETQLEKIICDADLDYLGREDFYAIGNALFNELKIYAHVKDEKEWNIIQNNFLGNHHYYTWFSRSHRGSKKMKHLKEIKQLLLDYE